MLRPLRGGRGPCPSPIRPSFNDVQDERIGRPVQDERMGKAGRPFILNRPPYPFILNIVAG